jgi:hypothetical protein
MPQRKQSLTDDSMEYIDDSDLEEHNSIVDNEGTASLEEANQKSLQQSYHELSFKLIADDSSKIQVASQLHSSKTSSRKADVNRFQ